MQGSCHQWERSALRLGNRFGCIPRRFLPDCLRGQALRAVPLSYPLAVRLCGLHQHQG